MVRNLDMKTPARYAVSVGLALAAFFLGRAAGAGAKLLPVAFDRSAWVLLVVSFGLLASFAADAFRSTRKQSVIFWGRGAEAQYCVAAADALGKPVRNLYHRRWHTPEDAPVAHASSVTLLRDARGVQAGKIAIIRDIGERKKIERERDANESRLRVALDHIDVAVFKQDRDLRYTWIYQPQLLTADEVLGKTDYDLLAGMVERARALEGEVRFQRGAERGAIVTASIPLAGEVRS
jgi:PAS domain-containing protein